MALYTPGQPRDTALLTTHGGIGDLRLHFAHLYRVVQVPGSALGNRFAVQTTFYQYRILDFDLNEIVVYDWAPEGFGPIRSPHLHVSAAGSIILKQRSGSPLENQKTFLGSLHLPTGRIEVEDIVELLIREFQVVPHRADWEDVLAANREAWSTAYPR